MIRLPPETIEKHIEPKDFSSPGQAEAALRALLERRGTALRNAGYEARVARRMNGIDVGFYLELYPKHPHRHSPEKEHLAHVLVTEYRAWNPTLAIELQPKK